jgi:hypothetical protein
MKPERSKSKTIWVIVAILVGVAFITARLGLMTALVARLAK